MRIERILIKNYRQYAKVDISFPKKETDLNIIVGRNGVGKTTFLNVINWCLYGDEPHAYSKQSSLPLRNLSNDKEKVYVEIHVSADDGSLITFKRKESHSLNVKVKYPTGETQNFDGKDADPLVDSFVPKVIREFFFFDGEQLDNYFTDEKTKNIKRRISILSRLELLDIMDIDLNKKLNGIKKKAGSKYKDIDDLNKELEGKKSTLASEKELISRLEENKASDEKELEQLNKKLFGIPDVEKLEKQRQDALQERNDASAEITKIENQRRDLFILDSPYVFLNSAMQYVLDDIAYKKKNNELPKPIDEEVIRESLEKHVCKVCGQHLEGEKWYELNQTLTTYKMSTEQSKQLLNLESSLKVNQTIVNNYSRRFNNLKENYKKANEDYTEKVEAFKEIDKDYNQFNDDQIRKDHKERVKLEGKVVEYESDLIDHKANQKSLERDIEKLNKDYDAALEKDKKRKIYKKKKDFLDEAISLIQFTKEEIIEYTKDIIEKFTRDTFFDLIWKKDTYSDVKINDNYQVELIHNVTNSDSLGSASAAERELLVLAFTLGVHSISQFDSPLLIDTPLARVSDEHRVNFAKTFIEISKIKQITLLLTPAEYSPDIRELFDDEDILKYEIVMADDESHSEIKEVK